MVENSLRVCSMHTSSCFRYVESVSDELLPPLALYYSTTKSIVTTDALRLLSSIVVIRPVIAHGLPRAPISSTRVLYRGSI